MVFASASRNTNTANDKAKIAPATIRRSGPVRCSNLDQDSTQSCDGDIDQVANGKLRRLEMARIAVVLLFGLVVTGIALYGFASGSFA